jgi:uncharacterized protein (DUF1778 family)
MQTTICPKCGETIAVPDGKDFVICCDNVIFVMSNRDAEIFFNEIENPSEPNEALKNAAHNRKNERTVKS